MSIPAGRLCSTIRKVRAVWRPRCERADKGIGYDRGLTSIHERLFPQLVSPRAITYKDDLAAIPVACLDSSSFSRHFSPLYRRASCTGRDNLAAIATVYGFAKCFGAKDCHLSIDGSSLRSDICEAGSHVGECGRVLFRGFDEYVNNPYVLRHD